MAKIKHIAIASQHPQKTAEFFKKVFDLEIVGAVDNENTVGYYMSDGNVNLAILQFRNEVIAGDVGTDYTGIHHIGFEVEDAEATEHRLRKHDSLPMDDINKALHSSMGNGHGGRNVETKFIGPEGMMIDISQTGWIGTDGD